MNIDPAPVNEAIARAREQIAKAVNDAFDEFAGNIVKVDDLELLSCPFCDSAVSLVALPSILMPHPRGWAIVCPECGFKAQRTVKTTNGIPDAPEHLVEARKHQLIVWWNQRRRYV